MRILVLNWMARLIFLKNTVDRNTPQNNYVASNENQVSDRKSSDMWNHGKTTRNVVQNGLPKSEDILHPEAQQIKQVNS